MGPQLTNNKAHNVTRYDGMIMVGPLGPRARAPVPWSFVAPRACAVVAFVRPRFGSAPVEWHLAIVVAYYVVGKRCRLGRGTIHQHAYVSIRCDCCARAASGHAVAAPPISVMKSRRPHSITSSARASKVGGTVRPSAFAVLRLSTKSYLIGVCTGRAGGLSPLRMRST